MDEVEVRSKIINGYRALYMPEHPDALAHPKMFGWVYEHRIVAEKELGRPLRKEEEVHHLDLDPLNNRPSNLLVLEAKQHMKLHAWMRRNVIVPLDIPQNKQRNCLVCNKQIHYMNRYCGPECSAIGRQVVPRPTRQQLIDELETTSMVKLGIKYGVSDKTIKKWIRKWCIDFPPMK